LFKGRLSGVPAVLKENLVRLKLISYPKDAQAQLADLREKQLSAPFWDPLFSCQPEDPAAIVRAQPTSLYWNKETQVLSLSHFLRRGSIPMDPPKPWTVKFFTSHP